MKLRLGKGVDSRVRRGVDGMMREAVLPGLRLLGRWEYVEGVNAWWRWAMTKRQGLTSPIAPFT